MSETTNTSDAVTYEKGSWQDSLAKSTLLLDRSAKAKKASANALWLGATTGIEEWIPNASDDADAENFRGTLLDILGVSRKGDVSKIVTVAKAVRSNGLVLADYPNLAKAYAEATRLTKTVREQAQEDDAAEKAVEAIEAPKTATTPESAAALLLSKGIDGAVVAILDRLGADNEAAHRSFMRALSTEIAARVQAKKPKPVAKAPATPKSGASKAKPAAKKAAPKAASTKAKPVSRSKGDPNKKVLPAKAKPAPVSEPVHAGDDVPDAPVDAEVQAPVATAAQAKAKPVRRPVPVKR